MASLFSSALTSTTMIQSNTVPFYTTSRIFSATATSRRCLDLRSVWKRGKGTVERRFSVFSANVYASTVVSGERNTMVPPLNVLITGSTKGLLFYNLFLSQSFFVPGGSFS